MLCHIPSRGSIDHLGFSPFSHGPHLSKWNKFNMEQMSLPEGGSQLWQSPLRQKCSEGGKAVTDFPLGN